MSKLIALYQPPADPAAFDRYYFDQHVPLAKTIPGLLSYEVSQGAINTPSGPSAYHLAGILSFESMAAIQAALASPQGQAAAADLSNFAQAGVQLLIFDTRQV